METDTETDTPTDMQTDTQTDTEIDTDIDRDTDIELEYFCFPYVAIALYGLPVTHHGASSNKFQLRYKLVAQLPNENYDMLIFKKSIPPLGLLSKRCVSGIGNIIVGLKKGRYQRYVQQLEINSSYP
jgi:hypothetical protein